MNYEKAYKDALKRAKDVHTYYCDDREQLRKIESIFPELKENKDERIRNVIRGWIYTQPTSFFDNGISKEEMLAWLEKQGKQASAIRWYDTSLTPEEMRELLVEWDSEDATWHEVAFYHADTKTFWDGERQVENVTRWCYIDDMLEKQEKKPKWTEEDSLMIDSIIDTMKWLEGKGATNMKIDWLKSLKERIGG